MITVRIISEFISEGDDPHTSRDIYELETDQTYSPDVADDLVRRVISAVKADRKDRLNLNE